MEKKVAWKRKCRYWSILRFGAGKLVSRLQLGMSGFVTWLVRCGMHTHGDWCTGAIQSTALILALFRVLPASLVFIEQDHCVVHALDPTLAAQDLPGELRMLYSWFSTDTLNPKP